MVYDTYNSIFYLFFFEEEEFSIVSELPLYLRFVHHIIFVQSIQK